MGSINIDKKPDGCQRRDGQGTRKDGWRGGGVRFPIMKRVSHSIGNTVHDNINIKVSGHVVATHVEICQITMVYTWK